MIVGFSTSCQFASVALFDDQFRLVRSSQEPAPQRASGSCLSQLTKILEESGKLLTDVHLFAADLGPGSFTGVRVGVTLAKSLAWANGALCGGANAFDLIAADQTVVFPSKRGEWFVRRVSQDAVRQQSLPDEPFLGFGPGIEDQVFPDAKRFASLLAGIEVVAPEVLTPAYLIDPSISVPKKPYRSVLG